MQITVFIVKFDLFVIDNIITIKIDEPDYIKNVENRIREIKPKLNLKGFRPGKVPTPLINKMYGKKFLIEEINKITSNQLTNFIKLFFKNNLPCVHN